MRLNSSVVRKWKAQVRSKPYTNRADSGSGSGHLGLYGSNGESETAASLLRGKDSQSVYASTVGKDGNLVYSC